ncbi:MAG: hypothetical protein IKP96_03740 [Elusimicrobiaceae bacterium]|nr:hypothetical protein [Elusimicrobiaceae bacterium]
MKKWSKVLLLIGCFALFLFLILPFLEPPTAESGSQPTKAVPQIFTSNPLTKIAARLARLFNRPGKNKTINPARNIQTASAVEPSKVRFTTQPSTATDAPEAEGPEVTSDPDEENARFFLPQQEEKWVLVRQRNPDTAQAGMHEINIQDNAYDRYIKQERAARVTPAARLQRPTEVPDSKLARLFNPIKQFFGFGNGTPAQTGALAAASATSSDKFSHNGNKQARQFSQGQPAALSPKDVRSRGTVYNHTERLIDLINPTRAIKEAADLIAGSIQDPDAKENTRQARQNEYQDRITNALQERLTRLSAGAEPQDQLPQTANCDIVKGILTETEGLCFPPDPDEIEKLRQENRTLFQERTHFALPPTQLMPILSVTDTHSIASLEHYPGEQEDAPQDYYTKEMYRFMLEQNDCPANTCFWVANAQQQEDKIKNTFTAAGVDFQGDPLQKYEQLKTDFVNAQLAAHPNATNEEKQKIRQGAQQALPPYLLYNAEDFATLIQQTQEQTNGTAQAAIYLADATDAKAFADKYGYDIPFFYGKQGHPVLTESNESMLPERSRILINDLADHIVFMQGLTDEIRQDASRQAVQNTAAPAIQQIQEQLKAELELFNQNNSIGQTHK